MINVNYLLIEKDGKIIDHRKFNLTLLSFRPQSLNHLHKFDDIEGRSGSIYKGTTFDKREIRATFLLKGKDYLGLKLLLIEINKLFATSGEVYLIHSEQKGKRWKVLANSVFEPEYLNSRMARFDLDFISPQPFAESVGTTLDEFSPDSGLWGIGMNLPMGKDLVYLHRTNNFQIYNPSDVKIRPEEFPIKIFFKGKSDRLLIKNNTTGEYFQYLDTTEASDVITLDRLRHLKNGSSIFSSTSRTSISLDPGWNNFTVSGSSETFEIWFDFRFYYYL